MLLSGDSVIVNQLRPHKNKWAWDLFIAGVQNSWSPQEVIMATDIEQWKRAGFLSDDEKLVLKRCLGFFAGSESLVSNNLLLNIYGYLTDGECRQYLARQVYEEALHNWTVAYICDSLSLDIDEVYAAYKNIPAIQAKDNFLMRATNEYATTRQEMLKNLIIYYMICEGIFFYSGFAMLLSFGRQNKLPGISQQIHFTLRDESQHLKFGTFVITQIQRECPEIWNEVFKQEVIYLIQEAVRLEIQYAEDALPRGILGLNSSMFVDYVRYIANRRLTSMNLEAMYPDTNNPFSWLSEMIDLPKQKNFFETKVVDYQVGGLIEDF